MLHTGWNFYLMVQKCTSKHSLILKTISGNNVSLIISYYGH